MLRCAQQSLKTVIATAVAQNRQKAMSTASSRLDLEGIYPPIPTPFDDKEEIDYPALQRNIEKWSKIPFRGTVLYIYIYITKKCMDLQLLLLIHLLIDLFTAIINVV